MRRLASCVERWPECREGLYDPRCCRFPKSCSCTVYDSEQVPESDLEPASPAAFDPQLAVDAFHLLVAEGEWICEMTSGDWHQMTCPTCEASVANVTEGHPELRHRPGCRRAEFFARVRAAATEGT